MLRRKFINLAPQLTAVIAAPSFLGRAYAQDGVSDKSITIGSSAGLTGPLVNFAVGLQLGAKAAMQRINSKGGINGRQLQFQLVDDGYVPARTAENVKKMLADNSVFALMSCMGTANNTAILPMIEAANVPYVAPYTGAASLRKNTLRNVFHVRASYADECTRLVSRVVDMGITSLAIAYADNPFGKELLGDMQKTLVAKNVKAVAEVAVAVDGKNTDEVTGKLLAAKPSAVLLCTLGATSLALANSIRKTSPGLPLAGISVTFTSEALSQIGDAGKGIAITTVIPSPLSGKVAIAREYQAAVVDMGQTASAVNGFEAYINTMVLAEGIRRAGRDLTRAKLRTALASIDDFDLGGFNVGFGSAPYVGSKFVDLGILNNAGRLVT
jgi:branched-chain amino acid transport system substrate-binding protein